MPKFFGRHLRIARRGSRSRSSSSQKPGDGLIQASDATENLFNSVLDALAQIDAFSGPSTPTLFVVYAHDLQPQTQDKSLLAHAGAVKSFIAWLHRIRSRTISDRHPMPMFETREREDAACHDILEHQLSLLPETATERNEIHTIASVDKVVLCGSQLLRTYCQDKFFLPFLDGIRKAYNATQNGSRMDLRNLLESDLLLSSVGQPGFHHVLTKLGFLDIRRQRNPEKHGVILMSLDDAPMDYLPFTQPTELFVKLESSKSKEALHDRFFKLLGEIYTDQHPILHAYQQAYEQGKSLINSSDALTDDVLLSLIEESISTARKRATEYQNAKLRDMQNRAGSFHINQHMDKGFENMSNNFERLKNDLESRSREYSTGANVATDMDCLNAFDTRIDHSHQKDRNDLCAPDTGQWFFDHPAYDTFRRSRTSRLLFVTAEAGGGKSTTMRALIDRLGDSPSRPIIAYFFFKDDDDAEKNYSIALAALISQILAQDKNLIRYAKRPYEQYGNSIRSQTREMWQIMREIGSNADRDIHSILDAVDECADDGRKQLVDKLIAFFDATASTMSRLRFVISSRPYQSRYHQFDKLLGSSNATHLAGEIAKVQSDIRKVIRYNAQTSTKNVNTKSFLAIRVAFELISDDLQCGAGKRTIEAILDNIPRGLESQFDKMLRKSQDEMHARRLFSAILAARRKLKIQEFKVIYSLTRLPSQSLHGRAQSYEDLELPTNDDEFQRTVRSRCALFITFSKGSVHLLHQTAREYLINTMAEV
ncbi:hypothetical protein QQS21_008688 [Conoideocrella luteorostrata]|uniref:Nephrocystin 3-like N-terminal domain-containing protein n=1 Tax=Conoideocrella luteorostrata TaxID=1105319 RepID=A0AAJ0CIC5_9HYPO|nr:hypothetical protein QQS21_008688 [Conoideocrella luteorostrata]